MRRFRVVGRAAWDELKVATGEEEGVVGREDGRGYAGEPVREGAGVKNFDVDRSTAGVRCGMLHKGFHKKFFC